MEGIQEIKKSPHSKNKCRNIEYNTQSLLFAKTAGRCEICNELLILDELTNEEIIWGEKAHIYAFSPGGSRFKPSKKYLNKLENLMLLCPSCHTKIDKKTQEHMYTVPLLRDYKTAHEKRIFNFGEITQSTKVLRFMANVEQEVLSIDKNSIFEALLKNQLISLDGRGLFTIDFTNICQNYSSIYWKSKKLEIDSRVDDFYGQLKREEIDHVSVFAIGPIPLLMYLGSRLENKICTKFFQRHRRAGGQWYWDKKGQKNEYKSELIKAGKDKNKVAIFFSLSGTINISDIDEKDLKNHYIYQITLEGTPNYNFLNAEDDLNRFEEAFNNLLGEFESKHPDLKKASLFPAIPAPIAVVCGRALNKNAGISLRIFNRNNKGVYKYTLTINN